MPNLMILVINCCKKIKTTTDLCLILEKLQLIPIIPKENKKIIGFLNNNDFDLIVISVDYLRDEDIALIKSARIHEKTMGRNTPILLSIAKKCSEERAQAVISAGANDYINGRAGKKIWRKMTEKIIRGR